MSVAIIDARGLSCPQPIVLLHAFIRDNGVIDVDVLVDNEACKENVTRAATKQGLTVTAHALPDEPASCRMELRRS